jgi:protein-tyrosine phosphatase
VADREPRAPPSYAGKSEAIVVKISRSAYWLKIKNPGAPTVRRLEEEDWNDWSPRANVKMVLFLCTGNYYRSRFAEELFNYEAERSLPWIAQSCGLALERGANNVGPIAPVVLHALKELTISARGTDRFPQQCTVDDLAGADFVVAIKETEHRPLMRERFVEWEHGWITGTCMTSGTLRRRKP